MRQLAVSMRMVRGGFPAGPTNKDSPGSVLPHRSKYLYSQLEHATEEDEYIFFSTYDPFIYITTKIRPSVSPTQVFPNGAS
jgi:hypothetical protein